MQETSVIYLAYPCEPAKPESVCSPSTALKLMELTLEPVSIASTSEAVVKLAANLKYFLKKTLLKIHPKAHPKYLQHQNQSKAMTYPIIKSSLNPRNFHQPKNQYQPQLLHHHIQQLECLSVYQHSKQFRAVILAARNQLRLLQHLGSSRLSVKKSLPQLELQ